MTKNLTLTAQFSPIIAPGVVAATSGESVSGRAGATITGFGPPETGPIAGALTADGASLPGIFDQNGG